MDKRTRDRLRSQQVLAPLSPAEKVIEESLRHENPGKVFRQCLANNTASLNVIRLCMNTQRQYASRFARAERQKVLAAQKSDGLAAMILRHIWKHELAAPILYHDHVTLSHICFYAILEGHENLLQEWLLVPTQEAIGVKVDKAAIVWKGSLLRNMVAANLSLDTTFDAGPAIKCFFRAAENSGHEQARGERRTSVNLLPAMIRIIGALTSPFSCGTDPGLFEDFRNYIPLLNEDPAGRAYTSTHLKMWHPTEPGESDAMHFLRRYSETFVDDGSVLPVLSSPLMATSFQKYLQRATDVAAHNGNKHDLKWVKEAYKKYLKPGGNFHAPTCIGRPNLRLHVSRSRLEALSQAESAEADKPPARVEFPTFT